MNKWTSDNTTTTNNNNNMYYVTVNLYLSLLFEKYLVII